MGLLKLGLGLLFGNFGLLFVVYFMFIFIKLRLMIKSIEFVIMGGKKWSNFFISGV